MNSPEPKGPGYVPTTPLSEKLRNLRVSGFPGRKVLQSRVAKALGVGVPSISAYEAGAVPPPERLRDYAVLFASERWLEPGAPERVYEGFLDPEERTLFEALMNEIGAAAAATTSVTPAAGATDFWTYPPHTQVRIFCGRLGHDDAGKYADTTSPNYMRFRSAADIDALFELWGHLRSRNPTAEIRVRLGSDYTDYDLDTDLIVLGNIAQEQGGGDLIPRGRLPIRQVHVPDLDGEVFEVDGPEESRQVRPVFDGGRLIEDVGMLARIGSPHRTGRSLTICSGVFTRGVYGAVRATTAAPIAASNLAHLPALVPDPQSFSLLIRVPVTGHVIATPDLRDPSNILFISQPDGGRPNHAV